MAITTVEQSVLSSISDDKPWALVENFSTQPRWRAEDVNVGADIITEYARSLGLEVEVHEATIRLSIPHSASVTMGDKTFRAKPPSLSAPAPDGVTAKAVYVKADPKSLRLYSRDVKAIFGDSFTSWSDLRSRIEGRILVTEGFGNPALTSLAQEFGAVGLVVINPGQNIHWGTSSTVWGNPGLEDRKNIATIPVVAVNKPDGAEIRALVADGGNLTIHSVLELGWFKQKIPVVTIPGNQEADKFVLVHGHYDSWDVGVGDNATGDATLLGLADVLTRNRDKLRRSVKVAWWPGHSTGRYSGSTWYADTFGIELAENCVAVINCDSPGCRWATSYHQTTCMPELRGFVTSAIKDVTGTAPEFIRPKRAGDASFFNIGISSYYSLSSTMPEELRKEKEYYDVSGCGGNIAWHTEDDQMEIADREIFNTDLQIYTLSALRHASAEILPADWRVTVTGFANTLAKYAQAAGDAFDFSIPMANTQTLLNILDSFYDGVSGRTIAPEQANEVQMRLARILIPINFTNTPRFAQEPAIVTPELPALAVAMELSKLEGDIVNFALTDLLRGTNRYVAAIREAHKLVESVLK